jgi:hypothetical protein
LKPMKQENLGSVKITVSDQKSGGIPERKGIRHEVTNGFFKNRVQCT